MARCPSCNSTPRIGRTASFYHVSLGINENNTFIVAGHKTSGRTKFGGPVLFSSTITFFPPRPSNAARTVPPIPPPTTTKSAITPLVGFYVALPVVFKVVSRIRSKLTEEDVPSMATSSLGPYHLECRPARSRMLQYLNKNFSHIGPADSVSQSERIVVLAYF